MKLSRLVAALCAGLVLSASDIAGASGAIAYSAYLDGRWQVLYQRSIKAVGVPVYRSERVEDQAAPRISPDGKRIALEVTGVGMRVCHTPPDSMCERLQVAGEPPVRPAWRRGSNTLLYAQFVTQRTGEDAEIYATREGLIGSLPLLRMTGIQDSPDVSPNGRWLAYSASSTVLVWQANVQVVQHVWVSDLLKGLSRQLTYAAAENIQPRWSPDGKRLAFASNRSGKFEIWLVDPETTTFTQVTSGSGFKTSPTWSPNGGRILYAHSERGMQTLRIVEIETRTVTTLQLKGLPADTLVRDPDWHW